MGGFSGLQHWGNEVLSGVEPWHVPTPWCTERWPRQIRHPGSCSASPGRSTSDRDGWELYVQKVLFEGGLGGFVPFFFFFFHRGEHNKWEHVNVNLLTAMVLAPYSWKQQITSVWPVLAIDVIPQMKKLCVFASLPDFYCQVRKKIQPLKLFINTEEISSMALLCVWKNIIFHA